jgi:hypothetical protein
MLTPILAALAAIQVSLPAMPPAQPTPPTPPKIGIPKPIHAPRDVSKSPHLTPATNR